MALPKLAFIMDQYVSNCNYPVCLMESLWANSATVKQLMAYKTNTHDNLYTILHYR